MTTTETSRGGVILLTVLAGVLTFAGFTALAMARNGGLFEYALDDVYIHLAMAEQIANGGYGVNAGEYTSAASSPLYPVLLTPFAGLEIQRWLPLFWNIVALAAAAALLGLALAEAGLGRFGWLLAVVMPFALNLHTVAYTGMENLAHGAASLAIVIGLWRFAEQDRIGVLLIAGILLAPAFRLEGVALALAAGGTVFLLGRKGAGLFFMGLGLLPVVAFMGFLMSLGLDPLPNSVIAKLSDGTPDGGNIVARLVGKLIGNTQSYGGRYLLILILVGLGLSAAILAENRRRGVFGLAVVAAAFAHLTVGSIGWMDRYESYAVLSVIAAIVLLLSGQTYNMRLMLVALLLAGGAFTYLPYMPLHLQNMKAIYTQQGQMARFAKEHVRGPIAVNDLGYVSWQNPDYVLDLWGLASKEALETRLSDPAPGWAGPLADKADVRVAMIYYRWLGDAVPAEWAPLGQLRVNVPGAFLGGANVTFFATDPADAADLTDALRIWETDLPPDAEFVFVEELER